VATAPLCECKGLRLCSSCSRLVATVFVGRRQQRCSLVGTAFLSECECRGLHSPCSTLSVLTLNVDEDRVQRGSEKFTCRLDAPACGIKKVWRHYLVVGLPAWKRAHNGQHDPHRNVVLTALLDKREGLGRCSPCAPPRQ